MQQIVTDLNFFRYVKRTSKILGWDVPTHGRIYRSVSTNHIEKSLDVIEEKVWPWFARNGCPAPNWRKLVTEAVTRIQPLKYDLLDMRNDSRREQIIDILRPLYQIKNIKSTNYMPCSKVLHFFFPELIIKVDTAWIKNVCFRKLKQEGGYEFRVSGPVSLEEYDILLKWAANFDYDFGPYAMAFEWCLLGYCDREIREKKRCSTTKKGSDWRGAKALIT